MSLKDFFSHYPVFRHEEFKSFMLKQGPKFAATLRQLLNYHHKNGHIVNIRRLLYAVQSPWGGELSVDPYLIAAKATQDAVLAYHTALELHNLSYTNFEEHFYLSCHPGKPFSFRGQHYHAVSYPKRLVMQNQEFYEVETHIRQGVSIKATSLERTVVDILDRPDLGGGWEEVIRSLDHLVKFNAEKMVKYALLLNTASTIAKLGYFLERLPTHLAVPQKILEQLKKYIPKKPYYIEPSQKGKGQGIYIKKWELIVPTSIANRTWEEKDADI